MITVITFIFGLVFGSFLSVVFSRLEIDEKTGRIGARKPRGKSGNRGNSAQTAKLAKSGSRAKRTSAPRTGTVATLKQILGGRSRCDHCANPVRWYDNIPVISFILLKTRCRHCSKPISHYHPVLELSSGLYLVAAYLFYGLSTQFVVAGAFGLVLLLLFAYDLRHQLIPNVVVLPAIVAALAVIAAQFILHQTGQSLQLTLGPVEPLNYLIGGAVGGGFFLLMSLLSRGAWVGGGDIKLGLLLGLLLGWPYVLVALVLAYFIGTAYAVTLLAVRHATLKTNVAFGPMLVMGFYISVFYGEPIVRWYQNLVIPGVGV